MNADGSERRLLADGGARLRIKPARTAAAYATWPGHRTEGRCALSFRAFGTGQNDSRKVYVVVMNADGGGLRRLTRTAADRAPTWSPDGRMIALESYRDGNPEIYLMNADGSGQRNLTRNPGYDSDPEWSPDGKKIAFTTKREGNFEIYVMNADGSGQRNLTRNPGPIATPLVARAEARKLKGGGPSAPARQAMK